MAENTSNFLEKAEEIARKYGVVDDVNPIPNPSLPEGGEHLLEDKNKDGADTVDLDQANELILSSTPLEPVNPPLEKVPSQQPVQAVESLPPTTADEIVSDTAEPTDQARHAEKIAFFGGEKKYDEIVGLYKHAHEKELALQSLEGDEEKSSVQDELRHLKLSIIWEEFQGVSKLLSGEEKSQKMISDMQNDDKQTMLKDICDKSVDDLSTRNKIIKILYETNWDLTRLNKNQETREQIVYHTLSHLGSILKDHQPWKDKDFSLLFLEPSDSVDEQVVSSEPSNNVVILPKIDTTEQPVPPINETEVSPEETEEEQKERIIREYEKQKVISLLRDFNEEQNKETKTYAQMTKIIKEMKGIYERSLVYCPEIKSDYSNFEVNDTDYSEIRIVGFDKDNKKYYFSSYLIWHNLKGLSDDEKYKDNQELKKLIDDYSKTSEELNTVKDRLWQNREKIVYRFLDIGFDEWRYDNLIRSDQGLYGYNGYIWIKRSSDGKELVFSNLSKNPRMSEEIESLKNKYNITDDELGQESKNNQEISWSEEDKVKVKNFIKASEVFSDELVKEAFLQESMDLIPFDQGEIDQLIRTVKTGLVRGAYRDQALPTQYEARIVQDFMMKKLS